MCYWFCDFIDKYILEVLFWIYSKSIVHAQLCLYFFSRIVLFLGFIVLFVISGLFPPSKFFSKIFYDLVLTLFQAFLLFFIFNTDLFSFLELIQQPQEHYHLFFCIIFLKLGLRFLFSFLNVVLTQAVIFYGPSRQ